MIMARSQPRQPSPLTLQERLQKYLQMNHVLNLEIAFENAHADPNVLLIADRDDADRSNNGHTMLN